MSEQPRYYPGTVLIALACGFGTWQGRMNKMADLAEQVDPAKLAVALEVMSELGDKAAVASIEHPNAEFANEYGKIAKGVADGMKYLVENRHVD